SATSGGPDEGRLRPPGRAPASAAAKASEAGDQTAAEGETAAGATASKVAGRSAAGASEAGSPKELAAAAAQVPGGATALQKAAAASSVDGASVDGASVGGAPVDGDLAASGDAAQIEGKGESERHAGDADAAEGDAEARFDADSEDGEGGRHHAGAGAEEDAARARATQVTAPDLPRPQTSGRAPRDPSDAHEAEVPMPPPADEEEAEAFRHVRWSLLRDAAGAERARVRIEHPTLGSLRLEFGLEEDGLDVRVLAPSLVAALRLEKDEDRIRAVLREHGTRLAKLRVVADGRPERKTLSRPRPSAPGRLSTEA
ncbi:MAG: flagellar hook-length control protein FliK, partial [Sandaracinaceae bacterium]